MLKREDFNPLLIQIFRTSYLRFYSDGRYIYAFWLKRMKSLRNTNDLGKNHFIHLF